MKNPQHAKTNKQTIALFGTSADPPTAGHRAILCWLSNHYDLVAVWASDNPFKGHQISLEHRINMLNLLLQEMDVSRNNIYLYQELSYLRSLFSLEKARQIWGSNANFTLVIGSDLVGQIPLWYRVEELLPQVQLLIVPRPGYPLEEEGLETLGHLGGKWVIADLDPPAVSSTAYREAGDNNALTPLVQNYIQQKQLYQWQKA